MYSHTELNNVIQDKIAWEEIPNGKFSLTYATWENSQSLLMTYQSQNLPKMKIFTWKLIRGKHQNQIHCPQYRNRSMISANYCR